jgi:hypothetical protein
MAVAMVMMHVMEAETHEATGYPKTRWARKPDLRPEQQK